MAMKDDCRQALERLLDAMEAMGPACLADGAVMLLAELEDDYKAFHAGVHAGMHAASAARHARDSRN